MPRNTRQRAAISRVFSVSQPPLTPQEVLEKAQITVPQLGIATVYRAIKLMMAEGILSAVQLPGESPRYELADKQHHHHFHCRGCGKVFDINKCVTDFAEMRPPGFSLERHEVTLYGLCSACLEDH
ncbi:transcriptional repressor [bacterium]|nr:transcriptional repressor [bacterium]